MILRQDPHLKMKQLFTIVAISTFTWLYILKPLICVQNILNYSINENISKSDYPFI